MSVEWQGDHATWNDEKQHFERMVRMGLDPANS
jgi:hypothetical protein